MSNSKVYSTTEYNLFKKLREKDLYNYILLEESIFYRL